MTSPAALRAPRPRLATELVGWAAGLAWLATVVRWFDSAAAWRPAWLAALPAALPALATVCLLAGWARLVRRRPSASTTRRLAPHTWVPAALAVALRLPLAWTAAAGYVTADGALSGIVALRVREGAERLVFVPSVPYSGSLKSHLTAPLAAVLDPARAFALVSLAFYALAVAAACRLAERLAGRGAAWAAGLYLACAPAFVTQYSLSNDGNYVEVLALGPWALLLALRASEDDTHAAANGWVWAGVLVGLAFWCHILALMPALALAGLALFAAPAGASHTVRRLARLGGGFLAGYLPGVLWNAGHGWESLRYVVPGLHNVGEGPRQTLGARLSGLIFDHVPLLFGATELGGPWGDRLLRAGAWGAVLAVVAAVLAAGQAWLRRAPGDQEATRRTRSALLVWTAVHLAVPLLALPYLPGNPRYLLFLTLPAAVFLGALCAPRPAGRVLLAGLLALGLLGSGAQARLKQAADGEWRALVAALEQAGVRHCYSDFFVATKLNFLSEERLVCSAKLGPTTTEYFFEYRNAVDSAPTAAYVPPNHALADKLERRLARLGVPCMRRDGLLKPLLFPARKVDPQELFPERRFPLR